MPTTTGKAIKANLFALAQTLYPTPWLVSYGLPSTDLPDDVCTIGEAGTSNGASGEQEAKTLGTSRSREETVYVSLLLSRWRGSDSQQVVTELAFDALATLEASLRSEPTISGACRTADVVSWELEETAFDQLPTGRYAEIAVRIRCRTRI